MAIYIVETLADFDTDAWSLRERIAQANTSPGADTILFAPNLTGTIVLEAGELLISDDLVIDGDSDGDDRPDITIDADGVSRVLTVDDGDTSSDIAVRLENLVFTGGDAGPSGAVGGISNAEDLTLVGSTVRDNTAWITGGIGNSGDLTIIQSSVSGNSSSLEAGGIGSGGTLIIRDSTISNNQSDAPNSVGGLSLSGASHIINSTISGNSFGTFGDVGGILNLGGTLTVTNSTITENDGGVLPVSGITELNNTIVSGNNFYDVSELFQVTTGSNNYIGGNARLGPLQDNGGPTQTHKPAADSFVIDAGDDSLAVDENNVALPIDQRGEDRIRSSSVDIGAVEVPSNDVFLVDDSFDVDEDGVLMGDVIANDWFDDTAVSIRSIEPDDFIEGALLNGAIDGVNFNVPVYAGVSSAVTTGNQGFTSTAAGGIDNWGHDGFIIAFSKPANQIRIATISDEIGDSGQLYTLDFEGNWTKGVGRFFKEADDSDYLGFTFGTGVFRAAEIFEDFPTEDVEQFSNFDELLFQEVIAEISLLTDVSHGELVFGSNGIFTYTPDPDFNGNDTFTYQVINGEENDTATVSITVNPVNDSPVALDDTALTDEDTPVVIPVLDNDLDVDGDLISVSDVTQGSNGTVTISENGTLIYTPNADFFGPDSFSYTVTDGQSSDTAAVDVTVVQNASTGAESVAAIVSRDADKAEGDTGLTAFTFDVYRLGAKDGTATVAWRVVLPDEADIFDFNVITPSATVEFLDGEAVETIAVYVSGDFEVESDEAFTVELFSASQMALSTSQGSAEGVIRNDDGGALPATFSISPQDSTKFEGDTGTTAFTFTVTRNGDTAGAATVDFAVTGSGGNAADADDFGGSLPGGQVSFVDGQSTATVTVDVSGDTDVEANERFTVTLSNASVGVITGPTASGTILNDDVAPASFAIAADAADRLEGDTGTTAFTFTVTRSGDTSGAATVDYDVSGSGGDAADGADFGGALPSGQVSFADGESTATITVDVSGDTDIEADEGFTVTLSNASSGSLSLAAADGTIRNDDPDAPPPAFEIDVSNSWVNGGSSVGFSGSITIMNDTGTDQDEFDFDLDLDGFSFQSLWGSGLPVYPMFDTANGIVDLEPTGNPYWQPAISDGDSFTISFSAVSSDAGAVAAAQAGTAAFEAYLNDPANSSLYFEFGV